MLSERAYNRLANVLLLIGVLSALLFDSEKVPRAPVVVMGLLAGLAATVLYFWNRFEVKANEDLPVTQSKAAAERKIA